MKFNKRIEELFDLLVFLIFFVMAHIYCMEAGQMTFGFSSRGEAPAYTIGSQVRDMIAGEEFPGIQVRGAKETV